MTIVHVTVGLTVIIVANLATTKKNVGYFTESMPTKNLVHHTNNAIIVPDPSTSEAIPFAQLDMLFLMISRRN